MFEREQVGGLEDGCGTIGETFFPKTASPSFRYSVYGSNEVVGKVKAFAEKMGVSFERIIINYDPQEGEETDSF
jgi:hypothetical protein